MSIVKTCLNSAMTNRNQPTNEARAEYQACLIYALQGGGRQSQQS